MIARERGEEGEGEGEGEDSFLAQHGICTTLALGASIRSIGSIAYHSIALSRVALVAWEM